MDDEPLLDIRGAAVDLMSADGRRVPYPQRVLQVIDLHLLEQHRYVAAASLLKVGCDLAVGSYLIIDKGKLNLLQVTGGPVHLGKAREAGAVELGDSLGKRRGLYHLINRGFRPHDADPGPELSIDECVIGDPAHQPFPAPTPVMRLMKVNPPKVATDLNSDIFAPDNFLVVFYFFSVNLSPRYAHYRS